MTTHIAPKPYIRNPSKRDAARDSRKTYVLRWAKKLKAITVAGGKCSRCGDDRPFVLSFHHRDSTAKERSLCSLFGAHARWEVVEEEIKGCHLLCENCHRETHAESSPECDRQRLNKDVCLQFVGQSSCSRCGYSKSNWALEFHHVRGAKDAKIARHIWAHAWRSVGDLQASVVAELDKCVLLCSNCHKDFHFDHDRYASASDEILSKALTMRTKPKVDVERVIRLGQSGMTTKDVAVAVGCSYCRAYEILKSNSLHRSSR